MNTVGSHKNAVWPMVGPRVNFGTKQKVELLTFVLEGHLVVYMY